MDIFPNSKSFNMKRCWYTTIRLWTFCCKSSGHSWIPERSSFVNNSLSLSCVGSGRFMFSLEFTFVFPSMLPLLCSQFIYLSSVSSVLRSGANMGGTTLAAATQATLVPFLRTIFTLVPFCKPIVKLFPPCLKVS